MKKVRENKRYKNILNIRNPKNKKYYKLLQKREDLKNPGVEERNRKDQEEVKSQSMSEKMKKLKEKASIFHQLQRGRFRVIL